MCRRCTHLGWSTGGLDSAGSLITNTPAGEMPQVSQRGSRGRGKVPNSQSFPEHSNIYPFPSTFHLRLNQNQTCHRGEQAPASLMLPGCSDVCLLARSHLLSQESNHWMLNLYKSGISLGLQFSPQYFKAFQPSPPRFCQCQGYRVPSLQNFVFMF